MNNRLQAALDSEPEDDSPSKMYKLKNSGKRKIGQQHRGKRVLVGGHFHPDVLKQLRMIAAEEGTTNQALIAEALDLLFKKKGKDAIAL